MRHSESSRSGKPLRSRKKRCFLHSSCALHSVLFILHSGPSLSLSLSLSRCTSTRAASQPSPEMAAFHCLRAGTGCAHEQLTRRCPFLTR